MADASVAKENAIMTDCFPSIVYKGKTVDLFHKITDEIQTRFKNVKLFYPPRFDSGYNGFDTSHPMTLEKPTDLTYDEIRRVTPAENAAFSALFEEFTALKNLFQSGHNLQEVVRTIKSIVNERNSIFPDQKPNELEIGMSTEDYAAFIKNFINGVASFGFNMSYVGRQRERIRREGEISRINKKEFDPDYKTNLERDNNIIGRHCGRGVLEFIESRLRTQIAQAKTKGDSSILIFSAGALFAADLYNAVLDLAITKGLSSDFNSAVKKPEFIKQI